MNSYSYSLSNTWIFSNNIDGNIGDKSKDLLCGDLPDVCALNSRGIDSGIESSVHTLKMILKDYLLKQNNPPDKYLIENYFNTEMFKLVNLELEFIFDRVNDKFTKYILMDMELIFTKIQYSIIILGFSSILFSLIILFYLIFGFISKLNFYYEILSYSCGKFNKTLFSK